jgi:long-chain acyl-CoA synthetase
MSFERIWHKAYPAGVPKEIDIEKITMPEVLTRTAEKFPDNVALFFMGTAITYRELDRLVNRMARAFTDLGIKAGDKVAMLLPNIPQYVIANYATYRIGAITVMNNPLYTERELDYQLNDSDSTVLVTLDMFLPMALKLREITKVETIITCSVNDYLPSPPEAGEPEQKKYAGVYKFMDLVEKFTDDPVANAAQWGEVGNILYTGGTTGVSKGVMLTHANMSTNTQQFRAWFPQLVDGKEAMIAVYPFFHSAGYTGVQNTCIYSGWNDVLVPRPDPDIIIKMIEIIKPRPLLGVSTIFVALLNNEKFRQMDLSFVEAYLTGGSPMTVETIRQLKELRDVPVINIYGLTEICPMGTATPWGGEEKPSTVGIPFPSTDMRIVDLETGTKEMPQGEAGEVCFKGPQVMKGYYKKPEETAAALKDGWVSTGDVGYLDEDGYLTLVDRKKDLIVASGYNVYPQEVDEVLYGHPKVMEACTIGIPDEYRGENVKVYLVPKAGETIDKNEIIQFCKERLAAYKVPRVVEYMDSLPKSAVGKILRRELRDLDRKKREAEK